MSDLVVAGVQAFSLLWCQIRALLLGFIEVCLLLVVPSSLRSAGDQDCKFYEGTVQHIRLAPAKHSFSYAVRYCLVDLDVPSPSSYAVSQLAAGGRMTASEARALSGCTGRVKVLLLPSSAGYEQNPIVVYFCYDDADILRCCLAEVTNTPWADRVVFPFAPMGDTLPKPMHVSPLQDMQSSWTMRATQPGEKLYVEVAVKHPILGSFFVATLHASSVTSVRDPRWWGLFMAHRVAIWIYWHAMLLMLRKGLSFLSHPKSVPGSDYRETVKARNLAQGWSACPILGREERPIVWHDATTFPWA
mmetsp:Transcript_10782/g.27726  ORF Transcript_10782/g.27726 Transcript_10782/m.27726 type:complete len:303 (-) Transcript_10782:381-1289(-)